MNPLVERGNPCETWIFINSCRSNDSFRSERFEELGISNGNISVFLLSKTFVFSFLFWKRKKGWKGAERRKREERKKAYTSQICFFYGCKKLLFWLLSIVYTFLIAGKGQQCLTIFKVKFYNWKRNIGLGQLFFFLSHFFHEFLHLFILFFFFWNKNGTKRCDKDERKKGLFLCDFIFKLFSFLKRNKNHEIPGWSCQ